MCGRPEEVGRAHAVGAVALSKGVVELKIEQLVPNVPGRLSVIAEAAVVRHLVADNLRKMGYTNVASLAGGFKAWKDQGLPTTS